MELDEIRGVWLAHNENMERSLVISERLLRERTLDTIRFRLLHLQISRWLEVGLGVVAVVVSVIVLTNHLQEPRYWVVMAGLAIASATITGLCVFSLIQTTTIDYASPVVQLQRAIHRIRLAEYRAFKWTLLIGIVAWCPISLIIWELLTGVDALAHVGLEWLVANLFFGLVCLGVGQWLSRRYIERTDLSPWAQGLLDYLSGHACESIQRQLEELARFERQG